MSQLDRSIEQVLAIRTNTYLMAMAALLLLSAPIFVPHKTPATSHSHKGSQVAFSKKEAAKREADTKPLYDASTLTFAQ